VLHFVFLDYALTLGGEGSPVTSIDDSCVPLWDEWVVREPPLP
jgi:hypothetical protein